MAVISVEVPDYAQKNISTKKITFLELYNKMEKENWVDEKLEEPVEMKAFYKLLKDNL